MAFPLKTKGVHPTVPTLRVSVTSTLGTVSCIAKWGLAVGLQENS